MALEDIGVRVLVLGLGEFRRSVGTARDDIRGLEGTIRSVSSTASGLGTTLTKIGSGMIGLGRTMTLAITGPLALLVGSLVTAGAKFEDTFAGVTKTVGGLQIGFAEIAAAAKSQLGITVTTMDEARDAASRLGITFGELTPLGESVRKEFRELAQTIPVSTEELNKIGEMAGTFGVPADQIAEFTKIVAEMGATTDISAEVAVSGLAKLFNIVGDKSQTMTEFVRNAGSAIVALGNNSVSTQGDILNIGLRMAAAGDRAKFSIPELFAWSTTIGDVGARAEAGGTAVSRAINEMVLSVQTGGENLQTFAQVSGVSVDEFKKSFEEDASTAVFKFIGALNEGIKAGRVTKDMLNEMGLGGIRAIDILGRLDGAQESFTKNLETANKAYAEGIALQDVAEKRFQTVASQVQILKNVFMDLGITIFDLVKDDILELINKIKVAINWFKNLNPAIQRTILVIAGVAAALGPLLIVAGGVISMLGTLVTVVGALASPLGLAALGVGILVAAIGTMVGWETVINSIGTAFDTVTTSVDGVLGIIDQLLTKKASISEVLAALQGQATGPVPQFNVAPAPGDMTGGSAAAFAAAKQNADELAASVAKLGIPPQFITDILTLVDSSKGVKEGFDNISTSISNLISSVTSSAAFQDVVAKLPNDMKVVGDAIFGFVNQVVTGVGEFTKGFSEGFGPFIESSGPQITKIFENLETTFGKLAPLFGALGDAAKQIPWSSIGETLGKVAGLVFANLIDGLVLLSDLLPVIIDNVKSMINVISDVIKIIADLGSGSALNSETIKNDWQTLVDELGRSLTSGFEGMKKFFTDLVDTTIASFTRLYNTLIGHSIIPDMTSEILASFTSMKDTALTIFNDLVSGAQSILSGLFGGGEEKGGAVSPTVSTDQISALAAAVAALQASWNTLITSMTMQTNIFFSSVMQQFNMLGENADITFLNIAAAAATMSITVIGQFLALQTTAIAVFSAMGLGAGAIFVAQMLAATTLLYGQMVVFMDQIDGYWEFTTRHMYGHWLDFVAGANALTAEWVKMTIQSFDTMHNQGVGKIHAVRDAWKTDSQLMGTDTTTLSGKFGTMSTAIAGVGQAAGKAAQAVWGAAKDMIAAMQAVKNATTGSPELKMQHAFESFENYLKGTDFGVIIDKQMAMPSFMTEMSAAAPLVAGGSTTTINRNMTTGDIVGAPMTTKDEFTDTMQRIIRTNEALG